VEITIANLASNAPVQVAVSLPALWIADLTFVNPAKDAVGRIELVCLLKTRIAADITADLARNAQVAVAAFRRKTSIAAKIATSVAVRDRSALVTESGAWRRMQSIAEATAAVLARNAAAETRVFQKMR
jgi:hypothetical protein